MRLWCQKGGVPLTTTQTVHHDHRRGIDRDVMIAPLFDCGEDWPLALNWWWCFCWLALSSFWCMAMLGKNVAPRQIAGGLGTRRGDGGVQLAMPSELLAVELDTCRCQCQ